MLGQKQPQSVTYYTLSSDQLRSLIAEGVKETLREVGFTFDKNDRLYKVEKDDEPKPVDYWVKKLGVDRATLWRRQKSGILNPTYMGKKLFFRPSDIDRMFAALNEKKK